MKYRLTAVGWFAALTFMLPATLVTAQTQTDTAAPAKGPTTSQLAKAAQNPLANFLSFPFQDNTSFDIGPYNRTQNVLNFQPVLPFKDGRIITRTIIPFVWQPDVTMPSGTSTGFGDIQFTAFYSPATEGLTWGVGPILSMPTGGDERGTGKWSIGPSVVALKMPGQWVIGGLINNVWSFAGDSDRADVNQMLFQYFINYNFGETGWYLSSAPIITANWEAPSGNQWIVPFGLAIGKLSRVGSKGIPLNLQAGAFYNVVTPDGGPEWSTRVQAVVLLPASIIGGGKKK
jgi:hypothetical protein